MSFRCPDCMTNNFHNVFLCPQSDLLSNEGEIIYEVYKDVDVTAMEHPVPGGGFMQGE